MRYRAVDEIGPEHVGRRVTVRRALPDGSYSDTVGVCEAVEAASVKIRNRRGELVVIERSRIVAARLVE